MKRFVSIMVALTGLICLAGAAQGEEKVLKMSTTTSTQASGLLDQVLPVLEKDTGITVKVIAKGTGAAIRDGMDGNVDVIFVHSRDREEKFVQQGYGTKRYAVMHNDFVIIGPPDDPAGIKGMQDAVAALEKIARRGNSFVSRGDDSGTHSKEQALWQATALTIKKETATITKKGKKRDVTFVHPDGLGSWYLSIGQGMGKTIMFADEKQAYTLTDRGTYIKYKHGRKPAVDIEVLCEGDAQLANPYGIIPINPRKHPHTKYALAEQFADWMVSDKGQKVIRDYRLLGMPLFYPDALP